MSADKYPCIFSSQMETFVYIFSIIFLNIKYVLIATFLCPNVSTATPSTSGGSLEWYYIVGPISAFTVLAVGLGCYIFGRRQRGE